MFRSLLSVGRRFISTVKPSVEEAIVDKLAYGKLTKGIYKILKKKYDEYTEIEENVIKLAEKPTELEKYINSKRNIMNELEFDHRNFKRFIKPILEIEENKELLAEVEGDEEMIKLIKKENEHLLSDHEEFRNSLLSDLLPIQKYDKSNCTLEIKQAVGGKESALFAEWLMEGYSNFALQMGWRWETEKLLKDSQKHGIKNSKFTVNGHNAYKYFKHESGVHKYI